jgi:hypothetical protein
MAVTAISAYRIFDGILLESLEIWACNASNLVNTASVEWTNTTGVGAPGNTISDTALGTARPLYIRTKPPPGSEAAFWISSNTHAVCEIGGPQGSVVDIVVRVSLKDNDGAVAVTAPVVGAIPGTIYFRRLDSTTTNILTPISANVI